MDITGTMLWYYNICHRELWLMNRGIIPDQQDENIDIGRFIHEHSYKKKDKEVVFGNVKFDVIFKGKGYITIGETKKTSKYEEASKWQLIYYLSVLKEGGIKAKGVLLYPEEKKRTEVELDQKAEEALAAMCIEIESICSQKYAPKAKKIGFCKNCGYKEYCYA